MRRITAILLAFILCVSAAGCAGSQSAAPAPAPTETVPATTQAPEDPGAFLQGKWINVADGVMTDVTFGADGTAAITGEDGSREAPYYYASATVSVEDTMELTLRVVEENGIVHLKRDSLEIDLVPEVEYPRFCDRQIEITMDNWQEYFELRFITHCRIELYDGVQYRSFGIGFMLKEEYLDLLVENGADVDVTVNYDSHVYEVENPFSLEYVITDRLYEWSAPKIDAIDKASVVDRRGPGNGVSEHSDLYEQVAAFLATDGGYEEFPSTFYYHVVERMEVVAVSGTITLKPEL